MIWSPGVVFDDFNNVIVFLPILKKQILTRHTGVKFRDLENAVYMKCFDNYNLL